MNLADLVIAVLSQYARHLAGLYVSAPANLTPTQATVRDNLAAVGMAVDSLFAAMRDLDRAIAAMNREAEGDKDAPAPTMRGPSERQ